MMNGLDIYYSKNIGRGLKPISKSGSGLKPISKSASGLKPISTKGRGCKKIGQGLKYYNEFNI